MMSDRAPDALWPSAPFRRSERLARLVAVLEEEPSRQLSAAEAAALLNLERRYFSKFFRARAGMTFREWLRRVRLAYALKLLRETELPVSIVASQSGFGSPRSLQRTAFDRLGATPREYRRQHR